MKNTEISPLDFLEDHNQRIETMWNKLVVGNRFIKIENNVIHFEHHRGGDRTIPCLDFCLFNLAGLLSEALNEQKSGVNWMGISNQVYDRMIKGKHPVDSLWSMYVVLTELEEA